MNMDRTYLKLILVIYLGIASTRSAYAYNIYNQSPYMIHAWGDICSECYEGNIDAWGKASCPGNDSGCGGNTDILVYCGCSEGDAKTLYYRLRSPVEVSAHGWVEIYNVVPCPTLPPPTWPTNAIVSASIRVYNDDGVLVYDNVMVPD